MPHRNVNKLKFNNRQKIKAKFHDTNGRFTKRYFDQIFSMFSDQFDQNTGKDSQHMMEQTTSST